MPSCFSASLSFHAFTEEFQQLSGDKGPNTLISLFFSFQAINVSLSQSSSSLPKIPSSPAWGFNPATLKVAGLNPHAGEEGILGHEERDWLNDALITWNKKNRSIELLGPLSPDSCWNSSVKAWNDKNAEKHDGILAMYHDQGLIPMKVIALNYSVNTTIGLPFIRTSPDHGTGFDIAGKGIAQSQSMIEAIKAAVEMTNNSRLFNTH